MIVVLSLWMAFAVVLQGSAYVNNFDLFADIQCPSGQHLSYLHSYHKNSKEDRRWDFRCRGSGASTTNCAWSGYANNWDDMLTFMCPEDKVITGIQSYHDNSKEDRRFRFRCCNVNGKETKSCYITSYINYWDGLMAYNVPYGKVITGAFSYHLNSKEDRRWKLMLCSLVQKT